MNSYDLGDLIRLTATFTDAAAAPTDPTTLTLAVRRVPGGTATTYTYPTDAALVRESAGIYHLDYSPPAAGAYAYRWTGTGAVQAAAEGRWFVRPSNFTG